MATDKQKLKHYLSYVPTIIMKPYVYLEYWGNEGTLDEYKRSCETILNNIERCLDWNDIDEETADILHFGKWSDSNPKFRLIPVYLYSIIPNGLKVQSFMGRTEIWNGKQDNDNRFGYLAYGIEVK